MVVTFVSLRQVARTLSMRTDESERHKASAMSRRRASSKPEYLFHGRVAARCIVKMKTWPEKWGRLKGDLSTAAGLKFQEGRRFYLPFPQASISTCRFSCSVNESNSNSDWDFPVRKHLREIKSVLRAESIIFFGDERI